MGIASLDMQVNANADTTTMGATSLMLQNNIANNAETNNNIGLVDILNLNGSVNTNSS